MFIILKGSIKKTVERSDGSLKRMHQAGDEIELTTEDAALVNKKGKVIESLDVHKARAKAGADAKAAVEKAEKDAAEKLKLEKAKGGGK
jgi:hypothetical protein